MLINTLKDFEVIYHKLWEEISDVKEKEKLINQGDVDLSCYFLEMLIRNKIFQLSAFEIMLKINPDKAIDILKSWYLSMDLSNHIKDQVSDLEVMLSDVKDILGSEKLYDILNSNDFLLKNKKNKRVSDAILFALDEG